MKHLLFTIFFCGMIGYAIKKYSKIPDIIIRVMENHKREKLHRIHISVQRKKYFVSDIFQRAAMALVYVKTSLVAARYTQQIYFLLTALTRCFFIVVFFLYFFYFFKYWDGVLNIVELTFVSFIICILVGTIHYAKYGEFCTDMYYYYSTFILHLYIIIVYFCFRRANFKNMEV